MNEPIIEKGKSVTRHTHKGYTAWLRKLQINDSFVCDKKLQTRMHSLARQIGVKIITGKEDALNIRVERIE